MLMRPDWVQAIQTQGRTMVDYFIAVVLKNEFVNWTAFVSGGVSDVDDARSVDLMTGGGHLTLFEREVSKEGLESRLRHAVRSFLTEARNTYDFVFIDSAPGLSVLTECWLREVDFFVSPSKPDYISTHGLQFLGQFSQRDSDMGFAECLGVIISMKDINAFEDAQYERWLRQELQAPLLRPGDPARHLAADGGAFLAAPALLLGQVSRRDGQGSAPAGGGAAGAQLGGHDAQGAPAGARRRVGSRLRLQRSPRSCRSHAIPPPVAAVVTILTVAPIPGAGLHERRPAHLVEVERAQQEDAAPARSGRRSAPAAGS